MSSTYISDRAVVKLSDEMDPYVVLFSKSCESNLFPRQHRWSAFFFGRASKACRYISRVSYWFDDGGLRGGNGRSCTPEFDLKKWRTAFSKPLRYVSSSVTCSLKPPFGSISPEEYKSRVATVMSKCTQCGSQPTLDECAATLQFDLGKRVDLEAIEELCGSQEGTTFSPWQFFKYSGFDDQKSSIELLPWYAKVRHIEFMLTQHTPWDNSYQATDIIVLEGGRVLAGNALKWVCQEIPWHHGAKDALQAALMAIEAYREETRSLVKKRGEFRIDPISQSNFDRAGKWDQEFIRVNQIPVAGQGEARELRQAEIGRALNWAENGIAVVSFVQAEVKASSEDWQGHESTKAIGSQLLMQM